MEKRRPSGAAVTPRALSPKTRIPHTAQFVLQRLLLWLSTQQRLQQPGRELVFQPQLGPQQPRLPAAQPLPVDPLAAAQLQGKCLTGDTRRQRPDDAGAGLLPQSL